MTPHLAAFFATSIDGYIARADGGLDWLEVPNPLGEDYGFDAFLSGCDALVMGRRTYETVRTFGEWPYGERRVVVLSGHRIELPDPIADRVSVWSGMPQEIVARLAAEGRSRVYVDGGETIRRFLAAGLMDEMTITRIPILLGDGIALFGPGIPETRLRSRETRPFANGLVQTRYEIVRDGAE